MEALKLSASWKVVKVGDTVSDIKEAVNAGVWSVGVIIGSSEMGLSLDEFNALTEADQEKVIAKNGAILSATWSRFYDSINERTAFIN